MASVDVDEKVIAAKEARTQHQLVHISQYKTPRKLAKAKVEWYCPGANYCATM